MATYRHDVYILVHVTNFNSFYTKPTTEGEVYIYQYVYSFFFTDEEIILSRYMYTHEAYYYTGRKQKRNTSAERRESEAPPTATAHPHRRTLRRPLRSASGSGEAQ